MKSPKFMAATTASVKGRSMEQTPKDDEVRIATSASATPSSDKRQNWVTSTFQRVGRGRAGDGTPRSKKEGLLPASEKVCNEIAPKT